MLQTSLSLRGMAPAQQFAVRQIGFDRNVPADAVLELEFNEDIDVRSVSAETVWLRTGSTLVSGRAGVRGSRVLQFTPDSSLEPGVAYVLTAGAELRSTDGGGFIGQDLRVTAAPVEEPAAVESIEPVGWHGQRALRIRFTRPVSPLTTRGLVLESNGQAVDADARTSTDHREVWLVPKVVSNSEDLNIRMEAVRGRNGRILNLQRIPTGRKP